MLTLVPRVNEISQIRQVEMAKPTQEQLQMNSAFQQKVKENKKKTTNSEKSKNTEYRYDAKEKGNNSQQFKSKDKNRKKKDTEIEDNMKSGSFDIKI